MGGVWGEGGGGWGGGSKKTIENVSIGMVGVIKLSFRKFAHVHTENIC